MISRDPLVRAWIGLVTMSGAGALVANLALSGVLLAALTLGLVFLKSRLILRHYLGLAAAPSWARGFDLVMAAFCLLVLGLALAGQAG
jgi:uncharacterized membrane protein YecN with MAPEG domain